MTYAHFIGRIVNEAAPATPVVIGDYDQMKGWPGDIDGGNVGPAAIGEPDAEHLVFRPYIEDISPSIYISEGGLWLIADTGPWTGATQTPIPEKPFDPKGPRGVIAVRSGGLVVSLSYDCTPGADVDTADWDEEENYVEGQTPHLPEVLPPDPMILNNQLAVIPMEPGIYEITRDVTESVIRCRIAKVDDLSLSTYEKTLDWDETPNYVDRARRGESIHP
jgi:hypothetical protein